MNAHFPSRLLSAIIGTVLLVGGVSAQVVSQACFRHLYVAAAAKQADALKASLDSFRDAGCESALTEKTKGLSEASPPTLEGAAHLAHTQSKKRLQAMQTVPTVQWVPTERDWPYHFPILPPAIGGKGTARVQLLVTDTNGQTTTTELPTNSLSKEIVEKVKKQVSIQPR